MKAYKIGQSALEYVIMGLLLLVVSIGALSGMGGQVSKLLSDALGSIIGGGSSPQTPRLNNLVGMLNPPSNQKTSLTHASTPSGGSSSTSDSATPPNDLEGSSALNLANNLTQGQGANTTSVDGIFNTLNSLGPTVASQQLANELENLANGLAAKGQLTQTQANIMKKLASQGFEMANMQSLIENISTAGEKDPSLLLKRVTYSGVQYENVYQFARQNFDYNGLRDNNLGINGTNTAVGTATKTFGNLYQELAASGALEDPEIKAMVDKASVNILLVSEQMEDTTWLMNHCASSSGQSFCETGNSYYDSATTSFNKRVASTTTQLESQVLSTIATTPKKNNNQGSKQQNTAQQPCP